MYQSKTILLSCPSKNHEHKGVTLTEITEDLYLWGWLLDHTFQTAGIAGRDLLASAVMVWLP